MTTAANAWKHYTQRQATETAVRGAGMALERLDTLGRNVTECQRHIAFVEKGLAQFVNRGFWGRLKWLFWGK